MSLKKNIAANYASQIYVTLIGIVLTPMYVQYMGAEAYGLVGFFAMLQAWFNLLDLGLSPTIARESARYHGGVVSAMEYRRLFRALSTIFCTIAVMGGGILLVFSDLIATRWLKVESLPRSEVVLAVEIMALSVAIRWMGGLYKGVITGSERLVWISIFTALIATLKFVAVFASMWLLGFTPAIFFYHQLFVAVFELICLFYMSRMLLPKIEYSDRYKIGWSFITVKQKLKFALGIAFTSSIWILVTQSDKLILSNLLTLSDYGYFTLAALVASGIGFTSSPITTSITPRLTNLYAKSQDKNATDLYRKSTKLIAIISGTAAITIYFCAEPLLFAWSGSVETALKATPILELYAIANGILAVSGMPSYLQYAKGNMRYHIFGNIIFAITALPALLYFTVHFGSIGAAWSWLGTNTVFLLTWLAYTHHKIIPGMHLKWLLNDILLTILPAIFALLAISHLDISYTGRIESLLYLILNGLIAITASIMPTLIARLKRKQQTK